MTRYADPHRCPDCQHRLAPDVPACPACGLDLRGPVGAELFAVLTRADQLLAQLRLASAAGPEHAPRPGPLTPGAPRAAGDAAVPAPPVGDVPPTRKGSRIRPTTVPQLLLGLGALCLLVAALVFLAVTWSALGVAGRTGVLLAGTGTAAGATAWMARRELRGAAEALTTVTAGLVVLDLAGARSAGWLADPSTAAFLLLVGGILLIGGGGAALLLRRTPASAGTAAELAAVVGTLVAVGGLSQLDAGPLELRLALGTVLAAAAAVLARGRRLGVVADGSTVVAVLTWCTLLATGVTSLGPDPTIGEVWGTMACWPLLVAVGLAAGVTLAPGLGTEWRVTALGAALVPLALATSAPAFDESPTVVAVVVTAVLTAGGAFLAAVPRPWSLAALSVAIPAGLFAGVFVLVLLEEASQRYTEAVPVPGTVASGQDRLAPVVAEGLPAGWLLPVLAVTLAGACWALLRALPKLRIDRSRAQAVVVLAPLVAGAVAVGTLLLHPVPVWVVLATLLLLATVATVAAVGRPTWFGTFGPLLSRVQGANAPGSTASVWTAPAWAAPLWAAAAAAAALPLGFRPAGTAVLVLGTVLVLAVALHVGTPDAVLPVAAGAALAPVLGGLVWSVGDLVDGDARWTALVGLVALGVLAVGRSGVPLGPRSPVVLLSVEVSAALTALPLAAAGVDAAARREGAALGQAVEGGSAATWAAVYLTVAGVAAGTMALVRPDRRAVSWLGGVLLVLASWVRLAEVGVTAPEPYALPGATALLLAGLWKLRREPAASTLVTLGPGLALGLLPSLTWAWADPVSPRALVLGIACLVLVLGGLQSRWAAPLLAGAAVGAALVLREAAPYLGTAVPRWALIGAAGVLLTALGITWEQRVRQVQGVAQRLRSLR